MKLIAILLFAACMQVSAEGYTQTVTLSERNALLKKVFTEIHKQTGYTFFCNETLFENTRPLTIKVKDAPLETALTICLKEQGLAYTIVGKNIVIKEKELEKDPFHISFSAPELFIDIRGRVLNDKGEPLVNASIVVKGTQTGTTSDANGNFSINTSINNTLVITYIGYDPVEVKIKNQEMINISLKPSSEILNADVVVIGYGKVQRKDLTGSVSSVKARDIVKSTDVSLNSALQGRAAGVQVVSSEGGPGAKVSVSIRAGSSISASNEPLYVINGFPSLGGSNLDINVNDVESIEILKDASATAIYGSRGANGVVIITTKSGKAGKFDISYDTYITSQQVARKLKTLNAYQYAELQHFLKTNPRGSGIGDTSVFKNWQSFADSATVDWQDKIFRKPISQAHNISFTGGNESLRIMGSLGYLGQEGIARGTDYSRFTASLNTVAKLNKIVSNETVIYLTRGDRNGPSINGEGGVIYSIIKAAPWIGQATSLSKFLQANLGIGGTHGVDPYIELTDTKINSINFNGSLNTAFNFKLTENFTLRIGGGINSSNYKYDYFYPSTTSGGLDYHGVARVYGGSSLNWLNENTLSYNKTFGVNHTVDAVAGFTMQNSVDENFGYGADIFPIESLGYDNIGFGERATSPFSDKRKNGLVSYLGRVNYGFMDKYLFTFSLRADGSSKFPKHRWGYFPSAAFAWKVMDENFMKSMSSISTLKLRASWGMTGNEGIEPYSTYTQFLDRKAVFNERLVLGLAPLSFGNPDLKWETNIQTNIGLDLGIFKDRVMLTVDAYHKKSKDLLLAAPISYFSGFSQVYRNVGDIEVKGLELNLNTVNVSTGKFTWNTNFNIAFTKGKVLALNEDQQFFTLGDAGRRSESYIVKVGESLGSIFGYEYEGIFNTQEELVNGPYHEFSVARTGSRRYKDINGPDGKPDGFVTDDDRTVIGNGNPKFFGGFNNEFRYAGLDLSFLFTFSYGNDILNSSKAILDEPNGFQGGPATLASHWTNADPQVNMQLWDGNYNAEYDYNTSYLVEDGSYLRLKNVMLGYTLPVAKFSNSPFKKLRLYISGQNLLTFTKYTGYDPEVNYFNSIITPGADLGAYPHSKVYTLGLNVTF